MVVLTGFRPDLSFLSEMRLDLDPVLQAPRALAPEIDPNLHSCGSVSPHGAAELAQPEPGLYLVGMKSYGRAPTFLAMTGYEQVRSVVAELTGDHEAAARVELTLPDTGVCGGSRTVRRPRRGVGGGCCGPATAAESTRGTAAGHDRQPARPTVSRVAAAVATEPATHARGGLRRVLGTLCVTEITSWGILYYAFPVLSGRISADTGWSLTRLTAAFSLGLVVSAVARDRRRPLAGPARAAVADDRRLGPGRALPGRGGPGAVLRLVRRRLGRGRGGDECRALSAGVRRPDPLVRRPPGPTP